MYGVPAPYCFQYPSSPSSPSSPVPPRQPGVSCSAAASKVVPVSRPGSLDVLQSQSPIEFSEVESESPGRERGGAIHPAVLVSVRDARLRRGMAREETLPVRGIHHTLTLQVLGVERGRAEGVEDRAAGMEGDERVWIDCRVGLEEQDAVLQRRAEKVRGERHSGREEVGEDLVDEVLR